MGQENSMSYRHFLWIIAGIELFGIGLPQATMAGEGDKPTTAVNYGRPFETPTRAALIPLPPGAIEPAGWLGDWARTAREGYTGHMDEVHPDFPKAWAADYTMTGDQLSSWSKGAWPYEGGGYWFDGMIKLGYALHDDALVKQARSRMDVVVNRMNENSILFMWWLNKNNAGDIAAAEKPDGGEEHGWPIWANGLLGRALTGYYAGSGDSRILRALETAYGNNRSWTRIAWAPSNVWPALETYTWTGNKEIAAGLTELFASHAVQTPDRNASLYDSWDNRLPDETIPAYMQRDHGVHFNEGVNAWAAGYLWTGNVDFLKVPVRWYERIERGDDGLQPHGAPVSDEWSGPTGSFRGSETCTVAAYMWSQLTLLRITGQGSMGDRIERAFFNAGPATVSRDFKDHAYFQSPNRINKDLPPAGQFAFRRAHHPLCCVSALNRIVPNYVTNMWMATYDNGLTATQYGPCKVNALVADRVPVQLVCRTDYPFNDSIDIAVRPDREASFALSFRIPGWCATPEIAVNGSAQKATADGNGFVRIARLWKAGDSVRLRFPMTVRVKTGHDNDAKDTPYATVSYGPLLFALAIADTTDSNTPDAAAAWNYALDGSGDRPDWDITVERKPMPEKWGWQLDSPLTLRAGARRFDWKLAMRKTLPAGPASTTEAADYHPDPIDTLLPAEPVAANSTREDIRLIPYGCTKFRVSMFPITERKPGN
jgi:hypothetical protein